MKTAVETLVEWLEDFYGKELSSRCTEHIKQAKDIEKKQSHQYAEFAVRCDRKDMKILNFEDFVKLETFKS